MSAISKERKKLNMMNRDRFDEMNEYLSIKNLNDLIRSDLLLDILGMFQESEKRGVEAKEVFGDYKTFCDEIAKNAIHKTRLEKVLGVLIKIWLLLLAIIIYSVVMQLINGELSFTNMTLTISNEMLKGIIPIYFAVWFATMIRNKVLYRYPFGKGYIYFFFALFFGAMITFLIANVIKDGLSIPVYLIIFIVLMVLLLHYLYNKVRAVNYAKYQCARK